MITRTPSASESVIFQLWPHMPREYSLNGGIIILNHSKLELDPRVDLKIKSLSIHVLISQSTCGLLSMGVDSYSTTITSPIVIYSTLLNFDSITNLEINIWNHKVS
jgi:hypothetical protein